MKKTITFLLLLFTFYSAFADKSMNSADTIIVGSIEKSCPGGFDGFNKFVKKYVRAPAIAFNSRKVGTTYVSFIIEANGSISNVYTILAVGYGMDEEAVRAISASQNWIPATIDNIAVRSFCRVGVQYFADFSRNMMWIEAKQIE